MKKILLVLAALILIGASSLALSFRPASLALGTPSQTALPQAQPLAEMKLFAIEAGKMFSSAAFAYRGGAFDDERIFNAGAILVQHPRGALLFDAGFGSNLDAHVATNPWLARTLTRYEAETTVAAQLAAAGIAPQSLLGIVPTHAHWDHISGISDLPGVPVLVNQAERDFIVNGGESTALARMLEIDTYRVYEFENGPYLGFPASHDVFGDGSVVLASAPGHTPGSIVAFITLPSGTRYALVGDLVWQREGIEIPAERPWLTRSQVDGDPGQVRRWIINMHALQKAFPQIICVPAHDRRVWDELPQLRRIANGAL